MRLDSLTPHALALALLTATASSCDTSAASSNAPAQPTPAPDEAAPAEPTPPPDEAEPAASAPVEQTASARVPSDTIATPAPTTAGATAPAAIPPAAAEASKGRRHADLDPDNDEEIGPPPPIEDCEQRLADVGITYKPARIGLGRKQNGVYTCGSKQVVRVRRGPGKIKYSKSSPLLTCGMALALADFERVAQEVAQRHIGARITQIDHLGTYNCRKMAAYDLISEHSYANGFDLRRFHFANGKTAGVLEDFKPALDSPDAPETLFLRELSNRLFDEAIFSVVVTPYFDRLHRNHIHVDLARYRVDGSRP